MKCHSIAYATTQPDLMLIKIMPNVTADYRLRDHLLQGPLIYTKGLSKAKAKDISKVHE